MIITFETIHLTVATVQPLELQSGDLIAVAAGGPGPLIQATVDGLVEYDGQVEVHWHDRRDTPNSTVYDADDRVPLLHIDSWSDR